MDGRLPSLLLQLLRKERMTPGPLLGLLNAERTAESEPELVEEFVPVGSVEVVAVVVAVVVAAGGDGGSNEDAGTLPTSSPESVVVVVE